MNAFLLRIIFTLPGIVIGLVFHEFMHALAAFRLGDYTAKEQGRLTLNPLKHIDPVGFVFLLIVGFGWAKPVQINRYNLRRPRRDEVFISLAGPAANLVLALVFSVIYRLLALFIPMSPDGTGALGVFWAMLEGVILINYGLFLFNLIPIPPLDGSHLIFAVIKVRPETEAQIYRYGALAFMALLAVSIILEQTVGFGLFDWLTAVIYWMERSVFQLLGLYA